MIHYVLLHVQNVLQQSDCTSYLGSYEIAAFYERTRSFKQLKSCLNLIATMFCCSQIRWIALRVYKLRMGFSVPSIIWVGAEFMQITMQRTRPAWPAKTKPRMTLDCSRIAKEIAMMSGLFVEGRGQTLLYIFLKKTRIGKIRKIFEEN